MVWGGAKAPPLSFWRWHGRLLDCRRLLDSGTGTAAQRDVAIHATFCARSVADPTSEQVEPPGSIWNNRATAPQYPPRNANLDVVEGNLQRILKEIPRGP